MDEITLASESFLLLQKDLGLKGNFDAVASTDPFERLQQRLEIQIKYMLDRDFSGLINALYRMDIPEQQVKGLLELSKPDEVAHDLAMAIIEREKQKVLTRQQYRPS